MNESPLLLFLFLLMHLAWIPEWASGEIFGRERSSSGGRLSQVRGMARPFFSVERVVLSTLEKQADLCPGVNSF